MHHAQKSAPSPSMGQMTTGAILIVNFSFQPEQLRLVVECLEHNGYRCVVFDSLGGVREELSNPNGKLLLVGATSANLPALRAQVRDFAKNGLAPPVLVCLTQNPSSASEELLVPEIDDFLVAPLNLYDLLLRLRRLLQRCVINEGEIKQVKQTLTEHAALRQFIGQAPAFVEVRRQLPRLAACDVTVLITGETGTGKEMCARAIHYLSPRSHGSFIPINCSAIPTELFENEIFGHEAGAFTDARRRRRGLIAEAENGTLFLDEVDSLHPLAQVKLLRFLQDRQYKPLGASHYQRANTRLLVATNQDLQAKVREGNFREDLYFRINIVSLTLPPLRERREDILPLAFHLLHAATQEYQRPAMRFTRDAVQKLLYYAWPGNVRELENVIRRAVVLAEGQMISARDLKLSSGADEAGYSLGDPFNEAKTRVIAEFERNYLRQALSANNGNISQAARQAQKDRRTFFGLLKKHGLT